MDFYNVMRDPGEKFGQLYPGLFAVTPIQMTPAGPHAHDEEVPQSCLGEDAKGLRAHATRLTLQGVVRQIDRNATRCVGISTKERFRLMPYMGHIVVPEKA